MIWFGLGVDVENVTPVQVGGVCGIDVEHIGRLRVHTPQDPAPGAGFLLNLHNLDKTSNSKVGARLSTLRLPGLAAYDRGTSGMNPMGK